MPNKKKQNRRRLNSCISNVKISILYFTFSDWTHGFIVQSFQSNSRFMKLNWSSCYIRCNTNKWSLSFWRQEFCGKRWSYQMHYSIPKSTRLPCGSSSITQQPWNTSNGIWNNTNNSSTMCQNLKTRSFALASFLSNIGSLSRTMENIYILHAAFLTWSSVGSFFS